MKRVVSVLGFAGDPATEMDRARPYLTALNGAGIEMEFGATLDGFSGLVLMGGTDVNPRLYGEAPHPETESPDDLRDSQESALIHEALDRDVPILAMCRGMQILNVAHGGTLVQHLTNLELHRQRPQDKSRNAHEISILLGSRLASIAGSNLRQAVNSRHHQAIHRAGTDLIVSAISTGDQVIEAVERPDRRFVVGVQWHPENQTAAENGLAQRLFGAFAAAL